MPGEAPVKATEIREQIAAIWKRANDILGDAKDADELSEEQSTNFQKAISEAQELEKKHQSTLELIDGMSTARERFAYFYGQATGGKTLRLHPIHQDAPAPSLSLGEGYVKSEQYKELLESGALESDRAPVKSRPFKAASDIIHSNTGGPGDALVNPQYRPDILPMNERPLVVRDLFPSASVQSDTLIYARQTSRDSGVAAVGQAADATTDTLAGGLKPQSSIGFEQATASVKTIATYMVATRQMLRDSGVIQSLIDNQGRLMLDTYVDYQLLNGDGTGPNIEGILDIATIQTLAIGASEDNLDGIRTARGMVRRGLARAVADAIVINPIDSEYVDLLKDNNGLYRGGNPIGNFTFNSPIWGLRRVESEAIAEGTALVGAFRFGATVLNRQPMTVYTTDSHSDFFIRNLITILFEEALMFPVWWPSAFVEITLNDWGVASGS